MYYKWYRSISGISWFFLFIFRMKNARDVGITFPSALSNDEKHLKEMFEKLRIIVSFFAYVRFVVFELGKNMLMFISGWK